MKCIANRDCQVRLESGRAKYFCRGDVGEFDVCPVNFTEVDNAKVVMIAGDGVIDFSELKDDVIRALEFEVDDLKSYMAEFHPSVDYAHNIGRDKLVEKYLYARSADEQRREILESHASPVIDPVAEAATTPVVKGDDDSDFEALLGD